MVTYDLDGVLVGAYCAIRAEAVELALVSAFLGHGHFLAYREGLEGHVIGDADGEVGLGLFLLEVLEYGEYLGRSGVLGGQTVAAADDVGRVSAHLCECGLDIEVERLAYATGLLAAVEDGNPLDALGQYSEEILGRERPVEADGDDTDFLALCHESVHDLADGLAYGTHGDDDILGVGVSVVVERQVMAACQLADLTHVTGYDIGNGVVVGVACLTCLEIYVRVLGSASGDRLVGVEGSLSESCQGLLADHALEGIGVKHLYLLDLV